MYKAAEAEVTKDLAFGTLFGSDLPRVLRALDLWPACGLVVLALLDTYIVSHLGQVAGSFYQALINEDIGLFQRGILQALGLYVAATALSSTTQALADFLALHWRRSLTPLLQQLYCNHLTAPSRASCDNPDQRISQDVQQLCSSLAATMKALAAAPFQAVLYAFLTARAFGSWLPCGAALLFFVVGSLLQRALMQPVARRVYSQEAREGDLRAALHRVTAHPLEVALWRGQRAEHAHLSGTFDAAARNQLLLVLRTWALTCSTKALEYSGAMVNYCCLGFAVFTGVGSHGFPKGAGERAAAVSNASFFLITLIYSFTQLLDAAGEASKLAGLTARVAQLLEVLQAAEQGVGSGPPAAGCDLPGQPPHDDSGDDGSSKCPLLPEHRKPRHSLGTQLWQTATRGVWNRRGSLSGAAGVPAAAGGQHVSLSLPQQPGQDAGGGQPDAWLDAVVWGVAWATEAGSGGGVRAAEGHSAVGWAVVGGGGPSGGSIGSITGGGGASSGASTAALPGSRGGAGAAGEPATPSCIALKGGRRMEVSVHTLKTGELRRSLSQVFPAAPTTCPLVAIVSFQLPPPLSPTAPAGSNSTAQGQGADHGAEGQGQQWEGWQGEMDAMLLVFLEWQAAVCEQLAAAGHWCDAVDPRTGRALREPRGGVYSEVLGAQVFLGYERDVSSGCPLVRHPECGRQCYPASLFTSAPTSAVHAALAACRDLSSLQDHPAPAPQPSRVVLEVEGAVVHTPDQQLVVAGLHLALQRGGGLLLTGPSGCGKSTLVACLAGLWPLSAGRLSMPLPEQVMFLPQHLLAAPGPTLAHQLAYPDPDPLPAALCAQLLEAACLRHLAVHLEPPGGPAARHWGQQLSPGELQRLHLARVLLRRPLLAVLDEALSGVGPDMEAALLQRLAAQGTAILMVTHRPAAAQLLQANLRLEGDGSGAWVLC